MAAPPKMYIHLMVESSALTRRYCSGMGGFWGVVVSELFSEASGVGASRWSCSVSGRGVRYLCEKPLSIIAMRSRCRSESTLRTIRNTTRGMTTKMPITAASAIRSANVSSMMRLVLFYLFVFRFCFHCIRRERWEKVTGGDKIFSGLAGRFYTKAGRNSFLPAFVVCIFPLFCFLLRPSLSSPLSFSFLFPSLFLYIFLAPFYLPLPFLPLRIDRRPKRGTFQDGAAAERKRLLGHGCLLLVCGRSLLRQGNGSGGRHFGLRRGSVQYFVVGSVEVLGRVMEDRGSPIRPRRWTASGSPVKKFVGLCTSRSSAGCLRKWTTNHLPWGSVP